MVNIVKQAAAKVIFAAAFRYLKSSHLSRACLPVLLLGVSFSGTAIAQSNPISVESRDVNTTSQVSRRDLADEGGVQFDDQVGSSQNNISPQNDLVAFRPPIEEEQSEPLSDNEMSYQMQLLQQEVQQLRGIVEKLSYELSRLQSTQDERYIELDGRFQQINERLAGTSSNVRPTNVDRTTPAAITTDSATTTDIPTNNNQTDKSLYDTALELIRGRQYDLAITQLQALISQYPESRLAPNAYYWLGEVYMAKPEPNYESARKSLAQVIQFFPDHRKVPDAAFKLGKVYNLMGDCTRAIELLNQVIDREQGKTVAKVAQTYLRDKVGECPAP